MTNIEAEIEDMSRRIAEVYPMQPPEIIHLGENLELCLLDQVPDRVDAIHNMLITRGISTNQNGTRMVMQATEFVLKLMMFKDILVNKFDLNSLYVIVARHLADVVALTFYTNDDVAPWHDTLTPDMERHALYVAVAYGVITELKAR